MNTQALVTGVLRAGLAALALSISAPRSRADEATPKLAELGMNDSAKWIPVFGDNIWAQYHPDWQGWFPGGHSNRFHELYVKTKWDRHPITDKWIVSNQDWVFNGEWFAVEWFYRASYTDDGFQQWESTLGIGRLKDNKLVSWTEYFDDSVGNLQHLRLMPVYDITEPVFPWPAKASLHLPYRP
jgi:hypothetical protein